MQSEAKFVFNRLYLNHVTSFDFAKDNGKKTILWIALKRSSQRIRNIDTSPQFDLKYYCTRRGAGYEAEQWSGQP